MAHRFQQSSLTDLLLQPISSQLTLAKSNRGNLNLGRSPLDLAVRVDCLVSLSVLNYRPFFLSIYLIYILSRLLLGDLSCLLGTDTLVLAEVSNANSVLEQFVKLFERAALHLWQEEEEEHYFRSALS